MLIALVLVAIVVLITEFASNVATASGIMPVVAGLIAATGVDPLLLALPAAFAASWGFMLPSGHRPQRDRLGDRPHRAAADAEGRAAARPGRDSADGRDRLDDRRPARLGASHEAITSLSRRSQRRLGHRPEAGQSERIGRAVMEDESDLTGATPRRRPKRDVLEIGGRKLKPSTLMMGHGYDPALSEGSLKPPIFLTSTFVFENAAAGKRHFEGVTGKRPGGAEGLVYSRFNGPNQEILEDRLGVWEDAEDALAFSSRHVGDRHPAAGLRPARRRDRPFRPALCRDRDADRPDPRPLRRDLARFPGRRDRATRSRR